MFGADQNKYKTPEEILEPQNFTLASYSKSPKTWKEGRHLEQIFYQVAKDEGVTPQEVKEIYFDAFSKVSQYMRHVEFPIIDIPMLGKLVPNMVILSKQIKIGHKVWDRAKIDNPDVEMPFFLKCLLEAYSRRSVEMVIKKPRYIRSKVLSDDEIFEIARRVQNIKSKKFLFMYYVEEKYGEDFPRIVKKINAIWGEDYYELKKQTKLNKENSTYEKRRRFT